MPQASRILTLDRPAKRNALSEVILDALTAALGAIADDRKVRAVIVAATGPVFSSGHDLKELTAHRADADRGRAYFADIMHRCATVMQAIVPLPKPVIAASRHRDCGRLPARRKLRSRGCGGHRPVRHAGREYRPVLLDADGRPVAQRWRASRRWRCC